MDGVVLAAVIHIGTTGPSLFPSSCSRSATFSDQRYALSPYTSLCVLSPSVERLRLVCAVLTGPPTGGLAYTPRFLTINSPFSDILAAPPVCGMRVALTVENVVIPGSSFALVP